MSLTPPAHASDGRTLPPPPADSGVTLGHDAAPGEAAPPGVPGHEIVRELGRGGMGVVYKARHLKLDRVVALKMILAGAHAGEDEMARFQTEAAANGRLPN